MAAAWRLVLLNQRMAVTLGWLFLGGGLRKELSVGNAREGLSGERLGGDSESPCTIRILYVHRL